MFKYTFITSFFNMPVPTVFIDSEIYYNKLLELRAIERNRIDPTYSPLSKRVKRVLEIYSTIQFDFDEDIYIPAVFKELPPQALSLAIDAGARCAACHDYVFVHQPYLLNCKTHYPNHAYIVCKGCRNSCCWDPKCHNYTTERLFK